MSLKGNAESENVLRGKVSIPETIHGKSAYEIAVMNGYEGTEEEWLEYLRKGPKGDGVHVRYSAHPDGTDFSAKWQRGFNYIGVAVGIVAPTDKSAYEWSVFAPGIYVGGGEMPDYADIQIDPDGDDWDDPLSIRMTEIEEMLDDIDTALDAIITIQNGLIGGGV